MILVVAERANIKTRSRVFSADTWLRLGLKIGAFSGKSPGMRRLADAGILHHHHSVNLNPPGLDRLDVGLADQVAALIRDDDTWHRVVICGRRAARCFGIDWQCYYGGLIKDRYVVMPHPSGRNRWWNQPEDSLERILTKELALRSLIGVEYITGSCGVCLQPLIAIDDTGLCPAHEGE